MSLKISSFLRICRVTTRFACQRRVVLTHLFPTAGVRGLQLFAVSAIFSQLPFACPPRVLVGALCVPCADVLLREAFGRFGYSTAIFPQFSRNFSPLDLTLPDRNPPPPEYGPFVWRLGGSGRRVNLNRRRAPCSTRPLRRMPPSPPPSSRPVPLPPSVDATFHTTSRPPV